ncbi:MAG: efflux transporter outer membrane subunit [Arenimonas sp.]|jgi:NodT family efflux transporter outer membrane factor (OMF) lipoprotein
MRNPLLRPLAAAVLSAMLAACAVGPNHVRPVTDTADRFLRAGSQEPSTPPRVQDQEFWHSFGDRQLSELIEQSLLANHDLRIALSRYDAANASSRGAKFDRMPTLTAEASTGDSRLSADQAPGTSRDDRNQRNHEAKFVASWELDLFGRIRRNIEARHAGADAAGADLQAMQVSIVAEVANQYMALRGLQERLEVARKNAQSQSETLRLVDSGLAAGRGTEFDVARAQAQLQTTSSRIPALEAQIAMAAHRLAVLSGRQPGALVAELEASRTLPALPPGLDPGTPGELLRRRPDVAAAEHRLHAATARIGVATADLFPRFTLGGLLGSQSVDSGALFARDSETRLVALGVDWSFLDVGRVRARIAASNAEAAGELARYQQTVLLALEETENALVRYDKARVEDQSLQGAAKDSARAAALARTRFEAGAGTLLDVLDAERSNLQAQDAWAQSRTRSLSGVIQLYRAMAGGWPTRLPRRERVGAFHRLPEDK